MIMKRNLTARYSLTQFSYWASAMGAASFATTYLLDKGLGSGLIGLLLAISGLLSCVTSPIMASFADRAKKFILPQMMLALSTLCILCFGLQLMPGLPVMAAGVFYILGMWASDAIHPLLNALNVACDHGGYPINFGMARGIGSVASATSALVLGHILARWGSSWMFVFLIFFRVVSMIAIAGFPKLAKQQTAPGTPDESCSIPEFFARYKWYCISILGIGFLGMFHAMTETYLISVMERLGGDSSNVGTALFISSISGAPVIFFYSFFRKRVKMENLLKISALTFLLKAVLFCIAPAIGFVYLLEILQSTSYGFLGPTQVYFAGSRVRPADMVKGQAFITAAYSLGCSGGNFAGGQLLNHSVEAMLFAGIAMALTGALILFLTLNKSDF